VSEQQIPAESEEEHTPKKGSILRETAIILVSALVLSWLLKTFLVQAFYIPSGSMEDTLQENDRILVSKMVPDVFDIHHGDIVVFKDPGGWLGYNVYEEDTGPQAALRKGLTFIGILPQDAGSHLVKRVIGMPGDTVKCCDADGKLTVNGVAIDETAYLKEGEAPSHMDFEVEVPENALWLMGDNRSGSADSRANLGGPGGGFVPIDNVVGTAFVKVWPWERAGWLKNPGDVFEDVPKDQ
jgi:signal peptidase I